MSNSKKKNFSNARTHSVLLSAQYHIAYCFVFVQMMILRLRLETRDSKLETRDLRLFSTLSFKICKKKHSFQSAQMEMLCYRIVYCVMVSAYTEFMYLRKWKEERELNSSILQLMWSGWMSMWSMNRRIVFNIFSLTALHSMNAMNATCFFVFVFGLDEKKAIAKYLSCRKIDGW